MSSLYEQVGGEVAVQAAVVTLYDKVMTDPVLAPFFEGLDMDAQIQKMVAFMTMALGGPNEYSGRDLRVAHGPLVNKGMGHKHFDAITDHMQKSLEELDIPSELAAEAVSLIAATRQDVLCL